MISIAIIADSGKGLQRLTNAIVREGDTLGMRINTSKRKVMIISRSLELQANIKVYEQLIPQVDQFKYFGCWVTNGLNPDVAIRARIEMARAPFLRMKYFLRLTNRERELLTLVKKQKTHYFGLIYRGSRNEIFRLLMECKIEGQRGPGLG